MTELRRGLAAIMSFLAMGAADAMPIPGQGTWQTTLQARDINRDGVVDAYYDTALNTTWLANWGLNQRIGWVAARDWATALDLYGTTNWRLPMGQRVIAGGSGYLSELAHMYEVTLGNTYGLGESGTCGQTNRNTANFIDLFPEQTRVRPATSRTSQQGLSPLPVADIRRLSTISAARRMCQPTPNATAPARRLPFEAGPGEICSRRFA